MFLNENLFILRISKFSHHNPIPPMDKITIQPSHITFSDKFKFNELDDKKNDDTSLDRITCYHSIERAIQMANEKNNPTKHYDVYQPIINNDSILYPYEKLLDKGLITKKTLLNEESWLMNSNEFKYLGTIITEPNNKYHFITKDYDVTDIKNFNEGNVVENGMVHKELKKKKFLYNVTYDKGRMILPDTVNYGNKISKKRNSSYWFNKPYLAIANFLKNHLINKGIIDPDEYCLLPGVSKLYLPKDVKEQVMLEISNLKAYLNIICIPPFNLTTDKHLGFGWDIKDYSYTYDKAIYADNTKELIKDDYLMTLVFADEERMNKARISFKSDIGKRWSDHYYIFNSEVDKS